MDHKLALIRSLVTTLRLEIEALGDDAEGVLEGRIDLSKNVREFEAKLIRTALAKSGGNQRKAARLLNLKTSTLNSKIKQLGIMVVRPQSIDSVPRRENLEA